jgi:hydrogenase nickel incorporation protein HypA/HybF
MHELSIALSILDIAAEQAGTSRVRAIHLKWGPLSGVAREALESAFALACEAQGQAETDLAIREMPIRIRCPRCQADRAIVSMQDFCCAECGAVSAEVTQGRELEIFALEIE